MALEDLHIYKMALHASGIILPISRGWTQREMSLIGDQLVRALISVSNNIGEGYARVATGERIQLLMYAEGSTLEARNAIDHAVALGCLDESRAQEAKDVLRRASFGIIEFAWAIASSDPSYKSPMKTQLEKRHKGIINARRRRSS
jgi:four helix bundle protein